MVPPSARSGAVVPDGGRGLSWMSPAAASQDLLYVSDNQIVTAYSYPEGKLEGTLKGFYLATGACVDVAGNVFIINSGTGKIFEYAHGGTKRIATLDSPTRDPVGCAVDLTTGNLAVGSQGSGSSGTVSIFKKARGKPVIYQDSGFYEFFFCGYDDQGNLFADGLIAPGSGHFALAELPRGKSIFTNITVDQYVRFPGGVQWDGKHLAVGDQVTDIYRLSISGSQGTIVGTTTLASGARYVKQFWIQGQTVIAPNVYIKKQLRSNVLFYSYPAGGKDTEKITDGVKDAQGAVVSLAAKRLPSKRGFRRAHPRRVRSSPCGVTEAVQCADFEQRIRGNRPVLLH
jgi:hypothetical protein